MSNTSKSEIYLKKIETINRLKDLINKLECGFINVELVSYLQTHDHQNGILILTSINDSYFQINKELR